MEIFSILSVQQNPLAQIEEERKEHQAKLKKMEKEMEEVNI
jgi:Skp family chaperone for outer membrane proteins